MILSIVKYGNEVLREKSKSIKEVDHEIRTLIKDMIATMRTADGVGLAANQVGLALRLLVIEPYPEEDDGILVFINPEITYYSEERNVLEEGCLSIPGINEEIKRPERIHVSAMNENGEEIDEEYDGLIARILQHEIDHLNGVLFIDYLSPIKRRLLNKKLKEIASEEMA